MSFDKKYYQPQTRANYDRSNIYESNQHNTSASPYHDQTQQNIMYMRPSNYVQPNIPLPLYITQQHAVNVQSQRQQRIIRNQITHNKQMGYNDTISTAANSMPKSNDYQHDMSPVNADKKDQQMIFDALNRMRIRGITDTKSFTWQLVFEENKNEYNKNANSNNDNNDEKYTNNNNNKNNSNEPQRLSQLIDDNVEQTCKYGHELSLKFRSISSSVNFDKCIICGSKQETVWCYNCYGYANFNKHMGSDTLNYVYCKDCAIKNAINIRKRIKMNNFKAAIIRTELFKNPSLEMDLLCNMKRRAALDWLIYDINKLETSWRRKWCLFVMDLDFLKCWNSCLGHVTTDLLIQKIGNIISSYINDINNGKWEHDYKGNLTKAYGYRTGGDEFVITIECGGCSKYNTAIHYPLGPFYFNLRKEINKLGENIKDLFHDKNNNNFNENEWKNAMENLKKAKDRKGNPVDMSLVGVSTGIFVPDDRVKEEDWLSKADKIALEHSKIINAPQKNGVSIYFERIGGLIPDEKVLKCLKKKIAGNYY